MSIKNMHYSFKAKLNKLDSQQNRNLLVPEIDLAINEAIGIFIRLIAEPRVKNHLGFETSQRSTDDIRVLVETDKEVVLEDKLISLPVDYNYFLNSKVTISTDNCTDKEVVVKIQQHDDEFENSAFYKSSFKWGRVNGLFTTKGLQLYAKDFNIDSAKMSYIRRHKYVHNAEDFVGGSYELPSGQLLTGFQDCELPLNTHDEIVDIAVMIVTGQLQIPDYQIKQNKITLNQIN